ncbi:MAG: hypothetical protein JO117_03435 [Verrucomicrobia bacterium]|nr:hypothetical protein [Verrucomicrobiota bacterium]MBV9659381.1 hypothetical protein [Verrucomicrobiota bacterium]
MLPTDSTPPLPDGPRFFGRRVFPWLAGGFLIGFTLLLAAVWHQSRQELAKLETAVPVVLLNATPDGDEPPE